MFFFIETFPNIVCFLILSFLLWIFVKLKQLFVDSKNWNVSCSITKSLNEIFVVFRAMMILRYCSAWAEVNVRLGLHHHTPPKSFCTVIERLGYWNFVHTFKTQYRTKHWNILMYLRTNHLKLLWLSVGSRITSFFQF